MNSSQIANIAARVKPLAVLLLLAACGSPAGSDADFRDSTDPVTAGSSGSAALAGMAGAVDSPDAAGSGGNGAAGSPSASSGGETSTAGMAGTAGAPAGQAGGSNGGDGGSATAGAGGTSAGHAGAAQAGSAGKPATDPLEPQPLPDCPGYVKVLVPKGTCLWLHGTFTHQTETCSLSNPAEGKCGTVSAVSGDTQSIVSEGAEITRLDFDATGCPKKCN